MIHTDPNAEWRRLAELYRTLPDMELLELAEDPDSLTEVARDAVQSELQSRNLTLPIGQEEAAEGGDSPSLIFASPDSGDFDVDDGDAGEARLVNAQGTEWIVIQSYQVAAEAAEARYVLEQAGVDCRLTDGSQMQGHGPDAQNFLQMELQVRECDIDRALDLINFEIVAEVVDDEDEDEIR